MKNRTIDVFKKYTNEIKYLLKEKEKHAKSSKKDKYLLDNGSQIILDFQGRQKKKISNIQTTIRDELKYQSTLEDIQIQNFLTLNKSGEEQFLDLKIGEISIYNPIDIKDQDEKKFWGYAFRIHKFILNNLDTCEMNCAREIKQQIDKIHQKFNPKYFEWTIDFINELDVFESKECIDFLLNVDNPLFKRQFQDKINTKDYPNILHHALEELEKMIFEDHYFIPTFMNIFQQRKRVILGWELIMSETFRLEQKSMANWYEFDQKRLKSMLIDHYLYLIEHAHRIEVGFNVRMLKTKFKMAFKRMIKIKQEMECNKMKKNIPQYLKNAKTYHNRHDVPLIHNYLK